VSPWIAMAVQALEDAKHLSKTSSDGTRAVLTGLATVVAGIADLRNSHGTGHGKVKTSAEIGVTQARLAIGAASTPLSLPYQLFNGPCED